MQKKVLITGSNGLVGSECVKFFAKKNWSIFGIDNNLRQYFFGKDGSTENIRKSIEKEYGNQYTHFDVDIRNEKEIEKIFKKQSFDLIIHTAGQPSHGWAELHPGENYEINALGTRIILENYRKHSHRAVFIFTSSSKVYGDNPNKLPLTEKANRFELPKNHEYFMGIDESMSIDQTLHGNYGLSKLAADIMVQEYGKNYGLKTTAFRCNCITGPAHRGVEAHGFLSYLTKCILANKQYNVFGYKGKQVRDNIHASDLASAFYEVYKKPGKGEIYNIGGGRENSVSILEAITAIKKHCHCEVRLGETAAIPSQPAKPNQIPNTKFSLSDSHLKYQIPNLKFSKFPRLGDHIWYITNNSKFRAHYPKWEIKYSIEKIIKELTDN